MIKDILGDRLFDLSSNLQDAPLGCGCQCNQKGSFNSTYQNAHNCMEGTYTGN